MVCEQCGKTANPCGNASTELNKKPAKRRPRCLAVAVAVAAVLSSTTRYSEKMNFDEQRIYYSYQNLQQRPQDSEEAADEEVLLREPTNLLDGNYADLQAVKRHCREFLSKCQPLRSGSRCGMQIFGSCQQAKDRKVY